MDESFCSIASASSGFVPEGGAAIRVVIPAYRSAKLVRNCIRAVAESVVSKSFEVVLIDDGENGDLSELQFLFPNMSLLQCHPSGSAAVARNRGCEGFQGDILVFVDVDVEVEPDAIEKLTSVILAGKAEASVGNYSSNFGKLNFLQQYKQLYLARVYSRSAGPIRNHFWTALGAVSAQTFFRIGSFNKAFPGAAGEDTEFGQRLTAAGHTIVAVPSACGQHLKPFSLKTLVKNDFKKGASMVKHFFGREGVKLTDSRHSSRTDIVAVFLAGAVVLSLVLAALPLPLRVSFLWGSGFLFLSYLLARRDLLTFFLKPGVSFLLRSVALMFLLDLVRVVCVVDGLGRMALRSRN